MYLCAANDSEWWCFTLRNGPFPAPSNLPAVCWNTEHDMMLIISLYAVAFFVFHSPTYGMVHLACWLAVPLLALYNGQRGRCRWLGKFFYYYYPAHMALIGLLARMM